LEKRKKYDPRAAIKNSKKTTKDGGESLIIDEAANHSGIKMSKFQINDDTIKNEGHNALNQIEEEDRNSQQEQ
jgi:hypothetical protein